MRKNLLVILSFIVAVIVSGNCALAAPNAEDAFRKVQIDNPKILQEQAIISYKNGNYRETLGYLENIPQNSINEESLLLLSNCYDSLGDGQKALDYIQKAIQLNPKSSHAYYNLGILKYKSGSVAEALECFDKSAKLDKTFSPALYNAGNCAYMNKEYKKALKYYMEAVRISPDNVNIYYNLSLTYEMLKDTKNADKCKSVYQSLNNAKND